MKGCLITFRSVTPAQRGELVLRKAGIDCNMRRTSRWMEEQGCGYSLHLPCSSLRTAAELLRVKGVAYRKIYRTKEDGTVEETGL